MRFPECFVAAEEARELQYKIEQEIARYIGKSVRPPSSSGVNYSPRYSRGNHHSKSSHAHSKRTTDTVRGSGRGSAKRKHS